MNTELIKEIRKKAIIEWAANNGITVHEFLDEPENIEALEKFAELIIKECLNVVKDVRDDCWSELATEMVREYMKAQSDDTMIAIKRHFGVE